MFLRCVPKARTQFSRRRSRRKKIEGSVNNRCNSRYISAQFELLGIQRSIDHRWLFFPVLFSPFVLIFWLKCLFCLHHKLVSFVCLILCLLLLHLRRPSTVFALSPHFAIITRLNCSRWRCRVQSSISLFVCVHFYALLTQRLFSLSLSLRCAVVVVFSLLFLLFLMCARLCCTWFSTCLFSRCAQVSFDCNHRAK